MNEFLIWLDEKVTRFPMHVDMGYNENKEWCVFIYKAGCKDDYPNSKSEGNDAIICDVCDPDMSLAFAKAQCEVKQWFRDNVGGF